MKLSKIIDLHTKTSYFESNDQFLWTLIVVNCNLLLITGQFINDF